MSIDSLGKLGGRRYPTLRDAQVGGAQSIGAFASGAGTTITCSVGTATASGISCAIDETIACGVGTATGNGISCAIDITIACSVGTATGSGQACAIDESVSCSVGTATASGIACDVEVSGPIDCSVGTATGRGVACDVVSAGADAGGGGPDRSDNADDVPAERFTDDKSGWRKPQWARERELAEAAQEVRQLEEVTARAIDSSIGLDRRPQYADQRLADPVAESPARAVSDSRDDGVAPVLVGEMPQVSSVSDIESARRAVRLRQERELELITTMLMMAA